MTIVLELPMPPSVNRLWRFSKKKRGHVYKDSTVRSWAEQAAWSVRAQRKQDWIDGACVVSIEISRPSASSDVDNRIKALVDSLQAGGAIRNDNQVAGLQIWWSKRIKGARVTIEKLTPAQVKRLEGSPPRKLRPRELCPGCGAAYDRQGQAICKCPDEALPQRVAAA